MLGDLATGVLVMLFGYAYPALESFKTLEQRNWPGEVKHLRFWCQYWVIVAIVTIIDRFGDPLVSWVPMYGEAKLAFFVYLWYPKTKGSDVIYESFLRPIVMQYEPDIEQRLRQLRANSGELLVFYLKNFTDKGTTLFLEVLNYVVSSASRASSTKENQRPGSSSRWNPIAALRSFKRSPTMEVDAHDRPNAARRLEEDDIITESLHNPRAEYRRPRRHQ